MHYAQRRLDNLDRPEFGIRKSEVLNMGVFQLFFSSPYSGLNSLSWNTRELFYNNSFYKVKGFEYTGDPSYFYFITVIDDDFEAFKVRRGGSWVMDHVNLGEEEVRMLEKVFSSVIEHFGWNKPFEERCANIKPTRIQKDDLEVFLSTLVLPDTPAVQAPQQAVPNSVVTEILECAKNPLEYFRTHEAYLAKDLCIVEPAPKLFLYVLMDKLMHLDRVRALDWKAGVEEIQPAIKALTGINPFRDLPGADTLDTETLLRHTAKILSLEGLCLVNFDDGSDSYHISVIQGDFGEFSRLCRKVKIKVQQVQALPE